MTEAILVSLRAPGGRRRRPRLRSATVAVALVVSGVLSAVGVVLPVAAVHAPAATASSSVSLAHLVGQKLVVAMSGATPDQALLDRIKAGHVGGVILFGSNITTAKALRALTAKLQAAATAGGRPPVMIAVDQEGGSVKRISWAPPTLSAPQMGSIGSTDTAFSQGSSTGAALAGLGVNTDLAPVADVPFSTSSFMYEQGRTWSFSAKTTSLLANAFASGLEAGGVVPAMKHFPGLGYATRNTDAYAVTIQQSATALDPGLKPYRRGIRNALPLVMLSNATYTAWDPNNAAGWSHAIGTNLLRTTLGFTGVTMTDGLNGAAQARGIATWRLAVHAARAGTDMILVTGSEAESAAVFDHLLEHAQSGDFSLTRLRASYDRILALKAAF